jgi:hypothetical protein
MDVMTTMDTEMWGFSSSTISGLSSLILHCGVALMDVVVKKTKS